MTPEECDEVVTTRMEFVNAISKPGRSAWLGADIELPSYNYPMADGVLVAGDMTKKLYHHEMTVRNNPLLNSGKNCRLLSIVLEGPDSEIGTNGASPLISGINLHEGSKVESCEVRNFPSAGVNAVGPDCHVLFSYVHHCRRDGRGYGCCVWNEGNFLEVRGCRIEYSRHHVSAGSSTVDAVSRDSYDVLDNIFGHSTNTQIDHHGGYSNASPPAGVRLRIMGNTFTYTGQRACGIRGYPVEGCWIENNRVYATTRKEWEEWAQETLGVGNANPNPNQVRMFISNNKYGPLKKADLKVRTLWCA